MRVPMSLRASDYRPGGHPSRVYRPAFVLALLAAWAWALATVPAMAEVRTGKVAWVIDGDTFRLNGGERVRIAGIDAPETRADQAKCRVEIERGRAATRAAVALLKGRTVSIERVGASYGRMVARVTLDGHDVGQDLIARGIAKPWPLGRPKPDWCG